MRLRLGATLVVAALLGGCGAGSHRVARQPPHAPSLERQLQAFLAQTPGALGGPRAPRALPPVVVPGARPGGPCFIATRGAPCSLTPCIIYAQGVTLERSVTVALGPGGRLGAGRCPPGARTSQTLRVSGP